MLVIRIVSVGWVSSTVQIRFLSRVGIGTVKLQKDKGTPYMKRSTVNERGRQKIPENLY